MTVTSAYTMRCDRCGLFIRGRESEGLRLLKRAAALKGWGMTKHAREHYCPACNEQRTPQRPEQHPEERFRNARLVIKRATE